MNDKWMQIIGLTVSIGNSDRNNRVFLVCVFTIVVIKLNCYIGTSDYADIINDMLVNLSYSYIAAYLFYQMTGRLPVVMRKRKLMPVIQNRVEEIGRRMCWRRKNGQTRCLPLCGIIFYYGFKEYN